MFGHCFVFCAPRLGRLYGVLRASVDPPASSMRCPPLMPFPLSPLVDQVVYPGGAGHPFGGRSFRRPRAGGPTHNVERLPVDRHSRTCPPLTSQPVNSFRAFISTGACLHPGRDWHLPSGTVRPFASIVSNLARTDLAPALLVRAHTVEDAQQGIMIRAALVDLDEVTILSGSMMLISAFQRPRLFNLTGAPTRFARRFPASLVPRVFALYFSPASRHPRTFTWPTSFGHTPLLPKPI